eukprot:NODE_7881_length_1542_cov_3.573145.p1 GENE.NODE_7881_length_1542_cov_3.573145~~NODE_7881_length_1542_cov_3.573145.p1  ORF type:complete len:199 (-),score=58.15 NODE_7881_length_1542_cov_3.573145:844-1440(-)
MALPLLAAAGACGAPCAGVATAVAGGTFSAMAAPLVLGVAATFASVRVAQHVVRSLHDEKDAAEKHCDWSGDEYEDTVEEDEEEEDDDDDEEKVNEVRPRAMMSMVTVRDASRVVSLYDGAVAPHVSLRNPLIGGGATAMPEMVESCDVPAAGPAEAPRRTAGIRIGCGPTKQPSAVGLHGADTAVPARVTLASRDFL